MALGVEIGLDIGGTKLLAAAGSAGRLERVERAPTPAGLGDGLALIDELIGRVSGGAPVLAIGAAIGGPLDWETGVVSPLHQPEWRAVPLKELLERRWGCPFAVDVDTNVAALGEYHAGGETAARFAYVTVSTGMGASLLIDGAPYRGAGGVHPEPGHQAVAGRCAHPERVACECGAPDCLEALVSGNAIRRVYRKPAEELAPAEWDEVAFNLGLGLRNLAALWLPEVVVLGGSVALGGGERLLAGARAVLAERSLLAAPPALRLSALEQPAPLLGALWLARQAAGA